MLYALRAHPSKEDDLFNQTCQLLHLCQYQIYSEIEPTAKTQIWKVQQNITWTEIMLYYELLLPQDLLSPR